MNTFGTQRSFIRFRSTGVKVSSDGALSILKIIKSLYFNRRIFYSLKIFLAEYLSLFISILLESLYKRYKVSEDEIYYFESTEAVTKYNFL